jgi:hypothetical protein
MITKGFTPVSGAKVFVIMKYPNFVRQNGAGGSVVTEARRDRGKRDWASG